MTRLDAALRLSPARMVWLDRNHNEPGFELARLGHRMRWALRARNRVERPAESRLETDRWRGQAFAGKLGQWPLTPTGNPYLLSPPFSGKVTPDPSHYLAGGQDFGPFPGGPNSIPHLYTRNLTPDKTGLPEGGHTFAQFLQIIRHGT